MFKKVVSAGFLFCASGYSELSEAEMRVAYLGFKASKPTALKPAECANSVSFLAQLTSDLRNESDPETKARQIAMMEEILYRGRGVGGFSKRVANPKEYTIMTEVAVILELWHKKSGVSKYFIDKKMAAERGSLVEKHYETLRKISITVDKLFDEGGNKKFFKDALPAIVAELRKSEADMTEDKLLNVPAMRQFDVLVANLMSSVGFMDCQGNRAADYLSLKDDDGLNPLRRELQGLMSADTITVATKKADTIEAAIWSLQLAQLTTEEAPKKELIGRAIAAVERIKSLRLDGIYKTKDPRAAEDKLKALPAADPNTKKKNTWLLLASMALQEKLYNPLATPGEIKKIILAKLQQSNYWEGAAAVAGGAGAMVGVGAMLANKTDLDPYPYKLPDYADQAVAISAYVNTVPKVYKAFVDQVTELAKAHSGSLYSRVGTYLVGGNTFLHLASSGSQCQCGFFSFGLMDDGPTSNARQKFFDIFSNSLEPDTLYSVALMSSVLEWIAQYTADARKDSILGTPAGVVYPSAQPLIPFLARLDKATIQAKIVLIKKKEEDERQKIFAKYNFYPSVAADYYRLEATIRDEIQNAIRDNGNSFQLQKNLVCTEYLRQLLLHTAEARKTFAAHAIQVLAGKLMTRESEIVNPSAIVSPASIYSNSEYQLLFRPSHARYIGVKDPENRVTALSPTQTVAEALNINVQALSGPAQFIEAHGRIDCNQPSRAFATDLYVLQDILVSETAKNQMLINFGGGHYEKLIPLADTVALARALRHLAWMGRW